MDRQIHLFACVVGLQPAELGRILASGLLEGHVCLVCLWDSCFPLLGTETIALVALLAFMHVPYVSPCQRTDVLKRIQSIETSVMHVVS